MLFITGNQVRDWTQFVVLTTGGIGTITGLFVSWYLQRRTQQDHEFRDLLSRFSSPHEPARVSAVIALGSIARTDATRVGRYRSQIIPFMLLTLEIEPSKAVRDATAYAIGQIGVLALQAVVDSNRKATKQISVLLEDLWLARGREKQPLPPIECPYGSGSRNAIQYRELTYFAEVLGVATSELGL
jgi:hypothetical protein